MNTLDEALIIKIKEGDNLSTKEFFEKYDGFFKYCSKRYKFNIEEVYEKVGEVLLNPEISIDNCTSYFDTVFKNEAIKRDKYKFRNELCSEIYDYVLKIEDNHSDFVFESYISSFDDEAKNIFRMKFKKGYSYQKIADTLDINISKVYRIVEKKIKLLRVIQFEFEKKVNKKFFS